MYVRFSFMNFVNWLLFSADIRVYPGLRALTFRLCAGFMAIFVATSTLCLTIPLSISAYNQTVAVGDIFDQNFSPGMLIDGELVLEDTTPVEYKGKNYYVVVDVTDGSWEADRDRPVSLFFLKDRMIVETQNDDSREYLYSRFVQTEQKINGTVIRNQRYWILALALISLTFLLTLMWTMETALMAMIGSFVVGIVAAFYRILLPRNEQLKIALTALVPMTVLKLAEHLLLFGQGMRMEAIDIPDSLSVLNILVFGLFLVLGARAYLLPYLPKNPE